MNGGSCAGNGAIPFCDFASGGAASPHIDIAFAADNEMKKTAFFGRPPLALLPFLVVYVSCGLSSAFAQMTFVHPGAVHGKAELDFVKTKIAAGEQPWAGKFREMRKLAKPSQNATAPTDESGQKDDGKTAYANALAWYYTGDETYAKNAIGILNIWGRTFKGYTPVDGQNLLQGGWIGVSWARLPKSCEVIPVGQRLIWQAFKPCSRTRFIQF